MFFSLCVVHVSSWKAQLFYPHKSWSFLSSAEISEIGLISGMKLGVKCLSAPLAWLPSSPYTTTHHLGSSEVIKNSGGICENSRIQGLWISRTEWIESDFHMCVAESHYIYQGASELHQCTIYLKLASSVLVSIGNIAKVQYFFGSKYISMLV